MRFTQADIDALLVAWPRLRRLPARHANVCIIEGMLSFRLAPPGGREIEDTYRLRIEVPLRSTELFPPVYELGGRIPRTPDHHVNDAGNLCLGSPLQLRLQLARVPTLLAYVEQCVVPFLYAASWREQGEPGFPFDELQHGAAGLLDDYRRLMNLDANEAVLAALRLLSLRPRVANKALCPCGCSQRLGRCDYRSHLKRIRDAGTRDFFRHVQNHLARQSAAESTQSQAHAESTAGGAEIARERLVIYPQPLSHRNSGDSRSDARLSLFTRRPRRATR